jgi:hypothetical protein
MQQKKKIQNALFAIMAVAAVLLTAGCATNVNAPEKARNPAPAEAFSHFSKFQMKPIAQGPKCEKQRGADVALAEIQSKLDARLGGLLQGWSAAPASGAASRTLIVEPVCVSAKMVGTTARIFGGGLAGDSGVVLNVRYIDASSGKLIAEPVFYQRASGIGGAYSFGATDRDMLDRITSLIVSYTSSNYDNAVGGPTGI